MTDKNHFLCPCEEEEATIKNPSATVSFCPFCGIEINTDVAELDSLPIADDEYDPWDSQDRDSF